MYRLTIRCDVGKRDTIIEGVHSSFVCPACKQTMIYLPNEKKIGAHGKNEKTIKHFLKKIEEQTENT